MAAKHNELNFRRERRPPITVEGEQRRRRSIFTTDAGAEMSKIVIFSNDFPATNSAAGFISRFDETDQDLIESLCRELVISNKVSAENIHILRYPHTFEVKGGDNLAFLVSPSWTFIDNVEISSDIKQLVDEGGSVGWKAWAANGKVNLEFVPASAIPTSPKSVPGSF